MSGIHHIAFENRRVRFDLTISEKFTIIRGDSGTGKSTMISMIRAFEALGDGSGISLESSQPCTVLESPRWKGILASVHESIVFIDTGAPFVTETEFAAAAEHSSDCFVIVTRSASGISLRTAPGFTGSADPKAGRRPARPAMRCTGSAAAPLISASLHRLSRTSSSDRGRASTHHRSASRSASPDLLRQRAPQCRASCIRCDS